MKNIVMELCCSTSGDSGFSSVGGEVVVGGISVVVTEGVVVIFVSTPLCVEFALLERNIYNS